MTDKSQEQSKHHAVTHPRIQYLLGLVKRGIVAPVVLVLAMALLAGCGGSRATRTPVPTWTPTPFGAQLVQSAQPVGEAKPGILQPEVILSTPVPTETPSPVPPTPTPTETPIPTDTPTPEPTATPTDTPEPTPTPTPSFLFDLESAEKLPTEGLAENVVRIFVYAYSPSKFGSGGYSIRVTHNGAVLPVDSVTTAGLPLQTRSEPGPYTRFSNLDAIFVESQAGDWIVELVDGSGLAVGPPATFTLSGDEITRELYVRYKSR